MLSAEIFTQCAKSKSEVYPKHGTTEMLQPILGGNKYNRLIFNINVLRENKDKLVLYIFGNLVILNVCSVLLYFNQANSVDVH